MTNMPMPQVTLYAIEEVELFRELYQNIFNNGGPVKLLGMNAACDLLTIEAMKAYAPDVVLIGDRELNETIIDKVNHVRQVCPKSAIIIIFSKYAENCVRIVKIFTTYNKGGLAVFVRQTLEGKEQLTHIITTIAKRNVLFDPLITRMLMSENRNPIFKELTSRELEVLNLVASSYTNQAIAKELFIDVKTVRHHINNIYSKIKAEKEFENRHPRVNLTRLYLENMPEKTPR